MKKFKTNYLVKTEFIKLKKGIIALVLAMVFVFPNLDVYSCVDSYATDSFGLRENNVKQIEAFFLLLRKKEIVIFQNLITEFDTLLVVFTRLVKW